MAPVLLDSEHPFDAISDVDTFFHALAAAPHEFAQPADSSLHSAALDLVKRYIDPVATAVSHTQKTRLTLERRNRKRKRGARPDNENVLRIARVTLQGLGAQQVFEQAKRVVDAMNYEVERTALDLESRQARPREEEYVPDEAFISSKKSSEEGSEVGDADPGAEDAELKLFVEESSEAEEDFSEKDIEDEDLNVGDEGDMGDLTGEQGHSKGTYVEDRHGLNDGFFSIDDFNRQTEFLEQVDVRGDSDDGAASDEEDVDWAANPIEQATNRKLEGHSDHSIDDEDDEAGPTFGNMDLDAPDGASEDEMDGLGIKDDEEDDVNANNIMYNDFFAPPPRKQSHKKGKKRRDGSTTDEIGQQVDDDIDIEQAMDAAHRDLFSDGSDAEADADAAVPAGASSHEKRKAAIIAQIRELEAENVAKKPWVMSGEARGQDRPTHALLEEELEFERAGKPLPLITEETSEEIEQLIKRRILASEFDEVRRRRPDDAFGTGALTRRGKLEDLDLDAPRKKGLAEIYEEEHLRRNDPAFVEEKDSKLKKEHAEIEASWKAISSQLDSLSSLHYRPKPAEMTVSVRSDLPAMSLEDARPSGAGGDTGAADQLAPQEIYVAGENKATSDVVTKGGTVVSRAEISRDQKKRRRNREKERSKKANQSKPAASSTGKRKQDRQEVVNTLKKGGVKVIGRKGEVRDVEGNEVKKQTIAGGSSLKL